MRSTHLILTLIFLGLLNSCSQQISVSPEVLMEIDRQFSADAQEIGIPEAFMKYCAEDAVKLKSHTMPIVGYEANEKNIFEPNYDGIKLEWEPLDAKISQSGDLGFTYGIYKVYKIDSVQRLAGDGCYVTIWQKDSEGNWKWVMDTGTEGTSKKEKD